VQLGELQSLLNKQDSARSQILAVSIDSHEDSKKLRQKLQAATTAAKPFLCFKIPTTESSIAMGFSTRTAKAGRIQPLT
jgi:hypothetical protein